MTPIAAETLTTGRLILRRPEPGDLEHYSAYLLSDRTRYIGGPKTRKEAFQRFCGLAGHWLVRGYGRYTITDRATGRPMGHVGAFQPDDTIPPEHTWTLWSGEDEGQGYAREAATAAFLHYRDDLCWPELTAFIHPDNAGSVAVARALGAAPSALPGRPPLDLRMDFDMSARAA
ncbi:GNAT family N-acetyltransferase [Pseudooceanicola sp.]|uniref:GNAT family N-acetyltransferase n=1 Tax=Pseudooceanicola sp. TaxID=1914328 RepID=UPI0040586B04